MQKPSFNRGISDGQYPAIIFQYIELGSQPFHNDKWEWYSSQVMIGFDFPTEGLVKSQTYFLSLNPSRGGQFGYRELADAIAGRVLSDEELENFTPDFIGKKLLVTVAGVESKGQVYSNIVKAEQADSLKIDSDRNPVLFEIDTPGAFESATFENLPEWIQDKISKSKEYQDSHSTLAMPNEQYRRPEEEIATIDLNDKTEFNPADVPFD